jgi:hypothetical protein
MISTDGSAFVIALPFEGAHEPTTNHDDAAFDAAVETQRQTLPSLPIHPGDYVAVSSEHVVGAQAPSTRSLARPNEIPMFSSRV